MNPVNFKYNVFESQKKYINLEKYSKHIIHKGYSRPIMLIVETINICNLDCIICAYSKMSRKKEIMKSETFKKVIRDYDEIGGGLISLTPVVGDVFLDKELVSRYQEILKHPLITGVSFTTNAIKSNNFNDNDLSFILQNTSKIHISIYGTDKNEYQIMSNRDQYDNLIKSIRRILFLVDDARKISFGFRSLKKNEEADYKQWIIDNFEIEIPFGSTNEFANWGVFDTKEKLPFDATWSQNIKIKNQCLIPLVACQVFVDGKVSFCPCDDFNNNEELHIGSIEDNTLLEIYNTSKTKLLWNFKQKVPDFCKNCSFYMPIEMISEHEFMYAKPFDFIGG